MGDAPPPEVEVIAAAPGLGEAAQAQASELAQISDHELQGKIQRVLNLLSSDIASRLADMGAKLRASLCQMQTELDRRKLVYVPKDAGECNSITQSKNTEPQGMVENYNANYTTKKSPSHAFSSQLMEKLEGQADAACNENSKDISQGKEEVSGKDKLKKPVRGHQIVISSRPTRFSSRKTPFRCVSSFSKKDQERSSNGDCKDFESFGPSPNEEKTNSSGKRRRASDLEGRNSVALKFKKVREVVLVDEEEFHSRQSTGVASDKWKEMMVYYPSRDDPESVELSYEDIKCLDPESYLSSPIINFYIQYLRRLLSPVERPKGDYHFFNTYFYNKLEDAVSYRADKACFEKLRRWWKGVNIFQKSYIFIPVHGDMHWSLVIICIPAKEDECGPIVLHLDSLGIHDSSSIFDVIERFLKVEWNYINQISPRPDLPISERIWRHLSRRIEKKKIKVPQQKNEYDCGLFVLYFMERFIEEAPERLRKKDLAMFDRKWFRPEDASGLRKRIRDLLLEVFRSGKIEDEQTESTSSSSFSEDD
ncbi:unnamed protein product [Musa banksii]